MPKAKSYFTLCIQIDGVWPPQFGDYSRRVVVEERKYSEYRRCQRIITTDDNQASIDAGVKALNDWSAV